MSDCLVFPARTIHARRDYAMSNRAEFTSRLYEQGLDWSDIQVEDWTSVDALSQPMRMALLEFELRHEP